MKATFQAISGVMMGFLVMFGVFFGTLMLLAVVDGWCGFASHPMHGSIPAAVVTVVALGFFVRLRESMLDLSGGGAWAQRVIMAILLLPILACLTIWFGIDWPF